ncbi:MAG: hypothetical protein K9N23_05120 [Akkermansiaceae bacterium]|nr:hypothetical protein [Akkermansiaceae bacterium]MCF7731043.1 hypothetical protein [Akkermansiaceae bacterium]
MTVEPGMVIAFTRTMNKTTMKKTINLCALILLCSLMNSAGLQATIPNRTNHIAAATNLVNYKDLSGDPVARVAGHLAGVRGKPHADVRNAAVTDYQRLFHRVRLDLETTANSHLPTDKRMAALETAPDPNLAALCYHFGRYLLISSSAPEPRRRIFRESGMKV